MPTTGAMSSTTSVTTTLEANVSSLFSIGTVASRNRPSAGMTYWRSASMSRSATNRAAIRDIRVKGWCPTVRVSPAWVKLACPVANVTLPRASVALPVVAWKLSATSPVGTSPRFHVTTVSPVGLSTVALPNGVMVLVSTSKPAATVSLITTPVIGVFQRLLKVSVTLTGVPGS